jgi:hypothetical protein
MAKDFGSVRVRKASATVKLANSCTSIDIPAHIVSELLPRLESRPLEAAREVADALFFTSLRQIGQARDALALATAHFNIATIPRLEKLLSDPSMHQKMCVVSLFLRV